MCYSTFSLLWSVYKYALFVVEREKTTKSPFEGKKPRAITPWLLNQFSQKLQGRRSSSRWLFFLLSVYTKYVLFVEYCRKTILSGFDLGIWSWCVFLKICLLPESHSLWCEDAKSIKKSIFALISSEWFYSLSENTLQNTENAKTARVITPSNTRLPSLNFQNIFRMCYSTFSLLWSVYKYALFVVKREKKTISPFKGK